MSAPAKPKPIKRVNKTSVRWTAQVREPGSAATHSLGTFATEEEAQARIDAWWATAYPERNETCAAFAARWKTTKTNLTRTRPFVDAHAAETLRSITGETARGWTAAHPDDAKALTAMFAAAVKEGLASSNPFTEPSRAEAVVAPAPVIAHTVARTQGGLRFAPAQVDAGNPAGWFVGSVYPLAVPAEGGLPMTVTLGGEDAEAFSMVGQVLRSTRQLESRPYRFTARMDWSDLHTEDFFELTPNPAPPPVNHAPTAITLSNTTISEDAYTGAVIGTLSAADPDAGDEVTFALSDAVAPGQTHNHLVQIDGNSLLTNFGVDADRVPVMCVGVRATDRQGATADALFNVRVLNVPDEPSEFPPTDIVLSASHVREAALAPTVVGRLAGIGQHPSTPLRFTLLPDPDTEFFRIQGDLLVAAARLDFETRDAYRLRVAAIDPWRQSVTKDFVITLDDVNEAPSGITISNDRVAENAPAGTFVGELTAAEQDRDDAVTFTLVPGEGDADNARFRINGRRLEVGGWLDYEANDRRSVRIRATDRAGLWVEELIYIYLTDADDTPTDIELMPFWIDESEPARTEVGRLRGVRPNPEDPEELSYALVPGPGDDGNGLFAIDGDRLVTRTVIDYERTPAPSVRVRVDGGYGRAFERAIAIRVFNRGGFVRLVGNGVKEGQAAGAVAGTLVAYELRAGVADDGAPVTFSLVPGPGAEDNGLFRVDGATLRTTRPLDREAKAQLSVRVRATAAAGSVETALGIVVLDAPDPISDLWLDAAVAPAGEPAGAVVGTLHAGDPGTLDRHEFALVPGDGDDHNASFVLDGPVLRTAATLNGYQRRSVSIRVSATESNGHRFEKPLVVEVSRSVVLRQGDLNVGITSFTGVAGDGPAAPLELLADGDEVLLRVLGNGCELLSRDEYGVLRTRARELCGAEARFVRRPALAGEGWSFEAADRPGHFIARGHSGALEVLEPADPATAAFTVGPAPARVDWLRLAANGFDQVFDAHQLGDGRIALQTMTGGFLTAPDAAGAPLGAGAGRIGEAETLTVSDLGGDRIGLRTHFGHHVVATAAGLATADALTTSGRFETSSADAAAPLPLRPVLVVGPATGPAGKRLPLAISVLPAPSGYSLADLEITGVPAQFDLTPATKGAEHAPGYRSWRVRPADLAHLELVPRSDQTVCCSLAVVATHLPTGPVGSPQSSLQLLPLSVLPPADLLRTAVSPSQVMTTIETLAPELRYRFVHRPLGAARSVVFQVRATNDAHIGFFADRTDAAPAYEIVLGGWGDTLSVIRRNGSQVTAAARPGLVNPAGNAGTEWTRVADPVQHLSVSPAGDVWTIGTDGRARFRAAGAAVDAAFKELGTETFKKIAAGTAEVWALDAKGLPWARMGITAQTPEGTSWQEVKNTPYLDDVAVGVRHQVWGLFADGGFSCIRTGIDDEHPTGTDWKLEPLTDPTPLGLQDPGQSISVAGRLVWLVRRSGQIFIRDGMAATNPAGTGWRKVDPPPVSGGLVGILLSAVSAIRVTTSGRTWARTRGGDVYVRMGVTEALPAGKEWALVPDRRMLQVAGGVAAAWGSDATGLWMRRNADAPTFWADARAGVVRVGQGAKVGERVLMSWTDPNPIDPSAVAVHTGYGSAGIWSLTLPGVVPLGARIVNQTAGAGRHLEIVSGDPARDGVWVDGARVDTHGNGLHVVVYDRADLRLVSRDVYAVTDPRARAALARMLDRLDDRRLVAISAHGPIAIDADLADSLRRCGASPAIRLLRSGTWAYALAGVPGHGETSGLEALQASGKGPARLDLTHVGGSLVTGAPDASQPTARPPAGSWRAGSVLISGLPAGASLSHGHKVAESDEDHTTMWAVPAEDIERAFINLTGLGATETAKLHVVVETAPAFDVPPSDAGATSAAAALGEAVASRFGVSDANAWWSLDDAYDTAAGADVHLPGGVDVAAKASVAINYGAGFAAGAGADTAFPCPQCDGTGAVEGEDGESVDCPRCGGSGIITGAGARVDVHAGATVSTNISVSVDRQIAPHVSSSQNFDLSARAGAEATGNAELYAGDGRYGGQASFGTFAGAEASFEVRHTVTAFGSNSVGGSTSVSSPGSVGLSGGGKAAYDNGKITLGLAGELGIEVCGFSVDIELTVDLNDLAWVAATAYDYTLGIAATTIISGAMDAVHLAEQAGAYIERGAGDAIRWGEGAALDAAEFFTDAGGTLEDAGLTVGAFAVDAGTEALDGVMDFGSDIADALEDGWNAATGWLPF